MRGRRDIAEPVVERLIVELRQRRRAAMHLLGGDPFDDALDLRPLVRIRRVKSAPVLLEVVVGDQPRAHRIRQLDDLDAIGRDVLGPCVEPDAVGLLQRTRATADVGCGVEHLELAVT